MSRAICAIVWEVLWKNQWAFPVLLLLWGVGGLMAHVHKSPPDAWWTGNPVYSALLAYVLARDRFVRRGGMKTPRGDARSGLKFWSPLALHRALQYAPLDEPIL